MKSPCSTDQVCPLCQRENHCQLAAAGTYKGSCWCLSLEVPREALSRLEPLIAGRGCLCSACLTTVASEPPAGQLRAGFDYYLEDGNCVFTAAYLARRGYCCANGCRHCPYRKCTDAA